MFLYYVIVKTNEVCKIERSAFIITKSQHLLSK